jgi:nucleoside-diphosphate-sugar epimerase
MSCVGRERLFEHHSRTNGVPMTLLRLNYATEMRYGVPVDIAHRVLTGQPISLEMGCFNAIWQGDANAQALASLACVESPPRVLNIAGPETLGVRRIAEEFGRLFGKTPVFVGQEAADALLSNAQPAQQLFGYPRVGIRQLVEWIADWLGRGMPTLAKPTHFESREGTF